jgi:uncharacterized membrane protein
MTRPNSRTVLLGTGAFVAALAGFTTTAHAATDATTLLLTTPFPAVESQPGSTVKFDVNVVAEHPVPVELEVAGLDDGWATTIRGGGFVIHEVTAEPDDGVKTTVEVDVPPDAAAGDHPFSLVAIDPFGARSTVEFDVVVAEQVDNGIQLTADFPSLSGDPGGSFAYTLTVDNETPIEQTFTFDPSAPQGWSVTASPSVEARAQTLTIDAGATANLKVTATAPTTADEGVYPIDVAVTSAAGTSGTITLQAEVVGTPKLVLGTADERLNVAGSADHEKRVPLIVTNTGSAPLQSVKLAGTAPSDWNVAFDPKEIDSVQPGETMQVTAVVTPSSDAVSGDYAMTVRASAGSQSSDIDLRYTVEGSRTLGFVAIGVIAAAFLALAGVFVKFGRR